MKEGENVKDLFSRVIAIVKKLESMMMILQIRELLKKC